MTTDNVTELRKQYRLRRETVERIHAEFSEDWPRHTINRFIEALAWICPNSRILSGPSNRELMLLELDRMESVRNLTRQLVAVMDYGPTMSSQMLWDVIGDAGFESLRRANKEADAWIESFAHVRQGTGGQDVSRSAMFVAIVANHWRECFPGMKPKPGGNFLRVCNALVIFEELPFNITSTAIKRGLNLDLF